MHSDAVAHLADIERHIEMATSFIATLSFDAFEEDLRIANGVFKILDGRQQTTALIKTPPRENAIAFQGRKGPLPVRRSSNSSGDSAKCMATGTCSAADSRTTAKSSSQRTL